MVKILIIIYIICVLIKEKVLGKIIDVILPFILASILAYIVYPLFRILNNRLPKIVSIIIVLIIIFLIIIFIMFLIPIISKELITLISSIIYYINIICNKYNIDGSYIISNLYKVLDYKYIINGISYSISYITNFIIFIISFIYILKDIDKIIILLNKYKNSSIYNLFISIDNNLKLYLSSLLKISIISFFEYYISFSIIKIPDALLIGIVASITNLIPYIGNIISLIIALILNPYSIIKVVILYLILSLIDNYIINPFIYGKYNKLHPLLEILSMSIFGYIFGIIGVIFSIPIMIIFLTIVKYYQNDISNYIKSKLFKNNLL